MKKKITKLFFIAEVPVSVSRPARAGGFSRSPPGMGAPHSSLHISQRSRQRWIAASDQSGPVVPPVYLIC